MSNLAKNVKDGFNNFFTTSNSFMANFLGGAKPTDMAVMLAVFAGVLYYVDPDMKRPVQKYSPWALVIGGGLTLFAWISQQYAWFLQLGIATLFAYAALQNQLVEEIIKEASTLAGTLLGILNKTAAAAQKALDAANKALAAATGQAKLKTYLKYAGYGFAGLIGILVVGFGAAMVRTNLGREVNARFLGTTEDYVKAYYNNQSMFSDLRDVMAEQGYTEEQITEKLDPLVTEIKKNLSKLELLKGVGGQIKKALKLKAVEEAERNFNEAQKFFDAVDTTDTQLDKFLNEAEKNAKQWNEEADKVIGE